MLDPSDPSRSDGQNPVTADVQRRGLRELRKLPGSGAAASTKRAPHDTLQKRALQDRPEEVGDALPRPHQFRMSEPVISSSVATEQAKLFHAIGMDLLHSLPEAAHGYVQRALRTAPKESWLLSEIMGSACVTLNRLKRHSEALRMAEQACELLKRGQQPTVQLAAMLHNKSACHEYLGDNASALQARTPCHSTHSHPVPPCALFAPARPLHPPHAPSPAPSPASHAGDRKGAAAGGTDAASRRRRARLAPRAKQGARSSKMKVPSWRHRSSPPWHAPAGAFGPGLLPAAHPHRRAPTPNPHRRDAVAPPSASPVADVAAAAPLLEAKSQPRPRRGWLH